MENAAPAAGWYVTADGETKWWNGTQWDAEIGPRSLTTGRSVAAFALAGVSGFGVGLLLGILTLVGLDFYDPGQKISIWLAAVVVVLAPCTIVALLCPIIFGWMRVDERGARISGAVFGCAFGTGILAFFLSMEDLLVFLVGLS